MSGKFIIPATRNKIGRKIDTWCHHFPDEGRADIDVFMISSERASRFEARSDHLLLKGQSWTHTDIAQLADAVRSAITAVHAAHSNGRWSPALAIEIMPSTTADGQPRTASLSITSFQVEVDGLTPKGNNGKQRITRNGVPGTFTERSVDDETHLRGKGSAIRMESNSSRLLTTHTEASARRLANIQDALETFGSLLGRRISPDRAHDLPEASELTDIMDQAVKLVLAAEATRT